MLMKRNNKDWLLIFFYGCTLLSFIVLLTGCDLLGTSGKNGKALAEAKIPITGKVDASGNTITFSMPLNDVGLENIYGLRIDSMTNTATFNIDGKASVLEGYNRPIVDIRKIVLYESIPKNTKVHRTRKVYDPNKNLLEIEDESFIPLTPAEMYILKNSSMVVKESNPFGSFMAGAMGSAVPVGILGLIWFIIKLIKYIPRIMNVFKEEKK